MLYMKTRNPSTLSSATPPAALRPLSAGHQQGPKTFYQWRNFYDETPQAADRIEASYSRETSERRTDRYFLLPGRKNTITRMTDDKAIDVRRMVGSHGPLEEWEASVATKFPIKRSFAAMIGQYVPRLRGSISSAADAGDVAESWARKSKCFETQKTRRVMKRGDVRAVVSDVNVEGKTHKSIALTSDRPEAIMDEIKRLGLKPKANTNFSAFLLAG